MANELIQLLDGPKEMLCLPPRVEWLASSLGTAQWPGQPMRYTLMSNVTMSEGERQECRMRLQEIQHLLDPNWPNHHVCSKARFALLTKVLLAYSMSQASEEASEARIEIYQDAICDIPPWALNEAIKKWGRGEVGKLNIGPLNFSFAPSPAALRQLCELELRGCDATVKKLEQVIAAIPIDRACDSRPMETENKLIPKLKMMRAAE